MKRLHAALLIALTAACGGGGSGDPITPPDDHNNPPPFTVLSGSFDVTSTVTFNGCERSTDYAGTYDVEIDSTSFSMGYWVGAWNPETVTASVETEHDKNTTRYCTTSTWTEVQIKFDSEDSFTGTIIYRYRLSGDCPNLKPCLTSWAITGIRRADP